MATTLLNNCTYANCVENFTNLEDLIYHIEEDHIDFSLAESEEQTEPQEYHCVPLSYVLKYSQLHPRVTYNKKSSRKVAPIKLEEYDAFPEHDVAMMEVEMSEDPFNDEFKNIINYSEKFSFNGDQIIKREFVKQTKKLLCPIPSCGRRYKNINGIKNHLKRIHNKQASQNKPKKIYKCNSCGKLYKTLHGLKTHSPIHKEDNINFDVTNPSTSQSSTGQPINRSTSLYIHQTGMVNKHLTSLSRSIDDDILPYRLLKHEMKLSEIAEYKENECNNYFEIITSPFADGNFIFDERFAGSLMLEEANQANRFMKKY